MKKIFWVDMEMSGLDPKACRIIEFAGIITDLKLKAIDTYHSVVHQPKEILDQMDEWNRKTHNESGLINLVAKGQPLKKVEREVIDFLKRHFKDEKPIMAGNSIHQDRRFIDRYMPKLAEHLHYRMLDVSSFKIVFKNMFQIDVKKNGGHRAFQDIKESIRELQTYVGHIRVN